MAHMEDKVKTIKSSISRTGIIDICKHFKKIIRNEYYERDAIFTLFTLKISSRQCCLNKFPYYRTVFNYKIHKIQLLKIKVFDLRSIE
jgi:phage gp16-like protein